MTERGERALLLAAGAMAAFGAGLLAYRWFVLGFGWSGGASSVMTGLAIGAFVGGAQGVRRAQVRKIPTAWWMRAAVALPAMAAGAGVGFAIAPTLGHVALHERDLGGFTIGLPGGDVSDEGAAYAGGGVKVERIGGFGARVLVKWEPGGQLDADQLASLMAAVMPGATATTPETLAAPAGLDVQSVVGRGDVELWVSAIVCGQRRFTLFSAGDGGRALHERVLATARCHPDAARDAELGGVPVGGALPPGWSGRSMGPGQVGFGGDGSADGAIVRVEPGTAGTGDVATVMPKVAHAMGQEMTVGAPAEVALPGGGTRTLYPITLTGQGQEMAGLLAMWACPERQLSLIAMYLHEPGGGDDAARAFLASARCAGPGEAVPRFPAMP